MEHERVVTLLNADDRASARPRGWASRAWCLLICQDDAEERAQRARVVWPASDRGV